MQIPAFTTSQRAFHPLIPPSLGINYTFRFKPFSPPKHVPIPFHSLPQTPVVKAVTTHNEAVVVETGLSNGHNEPRFIDIGYVSGVHGFRGDVRVKHNTDFPQLRFSTPGRRWLKQKGMGGETVKEVELEEGREHSGQNCWIIKFRGIDSVEKAKMLIGATLLVTEEDKPELEDGEFYAHDLNGMRVFMKENGQLLGTVINVFNNGGNDLLQISLDSSFDVLDKNGKPKPEDIEASGQLLLLPFVEAIVPDVDMNSREMHITPPKGLLELNLQFDDRSKKERRQLDWKERKKFQRRLIAAKKKLGEMDQRHVFHGFQCGEKEQCSLLSDQIVGVNSRLLQDALQSLEQPSKRWNAAELVSAVQEKRISTIHISEKSFLTGSKDRVVRDIVNMQEKGLELISKLHISERSSLNESKDKLVRSFMNMEEKGLELISKGKMAIVLLLNEKENEGCVYDPDVVENEATETSTLPVFQNLLRDHEKFVKVKDRASVPLILISSAQQIQSVRNLFARNNHFAFDSEKVFFLEEEKLPVVRTSPEGHNKYKILMKSPWEILQSPVGPGGFISLFPKHNIADNLINMGVEYVELCCPCKTAVGGNSLLLGLVHSREAKIGIQITPTKADPDENFDMILSMDFVKKITKQIYKPQFDAIPKTNSYVENVDEDWITVTSATPNSYELSCSVYSFLNACPLDKYRQNTKSHAMDAFRKQASKLRDQVAKQQQAVIKQFSGSGYESSDVVVIDEVELQRHQHMEKLYRATRAGRDFQKEIVKAAETFTAIAYKHIETGTKLSEECCRYGAENNSDNILAKAASVYGDARKHVEKEHEELNRLLSSQVLDPLRQMIIGPPLEDARHLAQRYSRMRQEAETQKEEISRRQARVRESQTAEHVAKLHAAEAKMQELKANMAVLGKEASAALAAVDAQQQRLTFQRLVAMVESEKTFHSRVAAIFGEIETEIVSDRQKKESAPPAVLFQNGSEKTMYFLAEAVHPYDAESENELSFSKGDFIVVRKVSQTGWSEGECNGKGGWFPSGYVEKRQRIPSSNLAGEVY